MPDCLFCQIIAGQIPSSKIYEDEQVVAFLDIHPVSEGHTLVVPKRHASNILESAPEDVSAFIRVIQKIALGVLRAVGADGFNLQVNNGASAGQIIFHTHAHLIPRITGQPKTAEHKSATAEELTVVAKKIRTNLEAEYG